MGKKNQGLDEGIDELNETTDKIKLTTDVIQSNLFENRKPTLVEIQKEPKNFWAILKRFLRFIVVNVLVPGIIVVYVSDKMVKLFNPSDQPIVYSISNLSNLPNFASQSYTLDETYKNLQLYYGNLNFHINISDGVLKEALLVYSTDDSNKLTVKDFHKLNRKTIAEKKFYCNKYELKVDTDYQYYSEGYNKIKHFYIVMLDKTGNYNIDLLLVNMKSNLKLEGLHGGNYVRPNGSNYINTKEYDKKLILGNKVLGTKTNFNNSLLQFKNDDIFSDKFDKTLYFKDKKFIEQYITNANK